MDQVMDADIRPPSLKLTAVAFARFLNDKTGQLNPSIAKVAAATGLSEVQARRQVHELVAMGILSVVANHDGGRSGASRWYCMHLDKLPRTPLAGDSRTPIASDTTLTSETPITSDRDGSHGRSIPLSPVIDTPLTSETQTEKEQGMNKEGNREEAPRKRSAAPPALKPTMASLEELVQEGFPPETASEFMAHKARMKAPLTERAWRDHVAESKKAGWTPLQAAEKVMAKSWKGFEAKYVADERPPAASRTSFAEQEREAGMRRWEEMTGRVHPDRKQATLQRTYSVRAVGFDDKEYEGHEHL